MKPILILKFGTASITNANGDIQESVLKEIARQVAQLQAQYRIVLVSSGAVGAGKKYILDFKGELSQRKAAAALGNPILMRLYGQHFEPYQIPVAQSLCERSHFANRAQFLQLKQTYETLWDSGVIPIANENDVVSDVELKFSDNDELATLLAAGLGAKILMFCTSVGGLLNAQKEIIPTVLKIDSAILGLADRSKSSLGLGGMVSKLNFAQRATQLGIQVIIFGIHQKDGILNALKGEQGTTFNAQPVNRNSRQKWLSTGSLISGKVLVDEGAAKALSKRKSLLAVGVTKITGDFEPGEVFEILNPNMELIAIARSRISSKIVGAAQSIQNLEIAHADDIVLIANP